MEVDASHQIFGDLQVLQLSDSYTRQALDPLPKSWNLQQKQVGRALTVLQLQQLAQFVASSIAVVWCLFVFTDNTRRSALAIRTTLCTGLLPEACARLSALSVAACKQLTMRYLGDQCIALFLREEFIHHKDVRPFADQLQT